MNKKQKTTQTAETTIAVEPASSAVLLCDCGSAEHQIIIHKDKDFSEGYREVILCPHLITYRNIFKRIWVAIKYILGYKCKYGAWDNIIVSKQNYLPLKEAIEFLEYEG